MVALGALGFGLLLGEAAFGLGAAFFFGGGAAPLPLDDGVWEVVHLWWTRFGEFGAPHQSAFRLVAGLVSDIVRLTTRVLLHARRKTAIASARGGGGLAAGACARRLPRDHHSWRGVRVLLLQVCQWAVTGLTASLRFDETAGAPPPLPRRPRQRRRLEVALRAA